MANANRPRQTMIIIGAGIAGLSTGCYAQMNGYRSRIFELHEVPGGGCAGWKRGEFGFDGCMSWLVGSGPGNELYQLWLELGALQGKEIRHFEMFNAVETTDGHTVRFYSDPDRLQDHLSELAPADTRRIRAFCHALRQFRGCLAAVPFLRPVGLMSKLDRLRLYLRFAPLYRAITRALATRIADCAARFESPVLREAFQYVLYDHAGQLSALPLYFQLACHGGRAAGVPEGGAPGLARSIEARYLALGGQIRYSARVEEILVESDRAIGVRLSDGQRHLADVVVASGDRPAVAELLQGRYVSPRPQPAWPRGSIAPGASGHVALFLGLDRPFPEAEHCTTHLLTEDEAAELLGIQHPGLHVQFRNRHYPELSPPGTSAIFATYRCDAARWRALSQGDDRRRQRRGIEVRAVAGKRGRSYPQEKRRVAEFLTGYLDRKYPGLADALVVRDVATPVTPLRCTGAHGDTVLPWQPFAALDPGDLGDTRPGVPGLRNAYLVGGDGSGGIVGDATAGRHLMQFICRDDRRAFAAWIDDAAAPPSHVIVPPGGRRTAARDPARAATARGVTTDRPAREAPDTRW